MTDNICPNTVHVLSEDNAFNTGTGALQVNGGISVLKNIHVGKETFTDSLTCVSNMRVGQDMYVCGKIHADNMYKLRDSDMIINYNLISDIKDSRYNLGSTTQPWENLHVINIMSANIISYTNSTDHLEVKRSMSIGNKSTIMHVDVEHETVYVDADTIFKNVLTVSRDKLVVYGQLYNKLDVVQIKEDSLLQVSNNVILLDMTYANKDSALQLIAHNIVNGFFVKILLQKNPKSLSLFVNNYELKKEYDMIEFMYIGNKFVKVNAV